MKHVSADIHFGQMEIQLMGFLNTQNPVSEIMAKKRDLYLGLEEVLKSVQ